MRVHRNLHNARRGGPQWIETRGGRKVAELDDVILVGVTTRIQPAGQRKCAESQVRSVCAFFDGTQVDTWPRVPGDCWCRISYDPRVDQAFKAGEPVGYKWNRADAVILKSDGSAWALNATWEA